MKNLFVFMVIASMLYGCSDFWDIHPTDKISPDAVFASEAGIDAFLANLYRNMPIEDFNCTPRESFNYPGGNNNAIYEFTITDDGTGSWNFLIGNGAYPWWEQGYKYNQDVNLFFSYLPDIKVISEDSRQDLYGQAHFMRAYTYYALAKRYGGVPIITSIADVSDSLALYVPRSTEKVTWDFALESCDEAIKLLGDGDGKGRRATKWAALALKTRIALHAASVAKYWNEAPLSGPAVDAKLVGGMTQEDAIDYYKQCIEAAEEIMDDGPFGLYKPLPANPAEAAENYRQMFELPNKALEEVIFLKGFNRKGYGHGSDQDAWANPNQTKGAWQLPGRFNPTLDLIDAYESYSNPGHSSPIVTTTDGITDNYSGYNASRTYLTFDDPSEIFADKDARMHGTVILPNSMWKNTQIIIQGGFIRPNGTPVILGSGEEVVNDVTYYTYGASIPELHSGFLHNGDHTVTGFLLKKFLNTTLQLEAEWEQSTTDYIDFRYAEVLLNYAEAVVESGQGNQAKAAKAINDLRKRAGHTSDIPLTLENVLRERRVELVYESKRHWDLIRRREYHKKFDNTRRTSLVPILDLRNMKYIFVRQYIATQTTAWTFVPRYYYLGIPGIGTNQLIQNPQY